MPRQTTPTSTADWRIGDPEPTIEVPHGAPTTAILTWPALQSVLVAAALGLLAAVEPTLALSSVAAIALGVLVLRTDVLGEVVVGAFWVVFGIYQTILADAGIEIPGIFYPFYGLLLLNLVVTLARGRTRIDRWAGWLYVAFMVLVLASFVGFENPVDFFVIQRVASYSFGMLVLFQVGSRRGLGPLLSGAVICGVSVSIWVIIRAAEGGFDYRGDIEVDQNFTAFVVGLGLVIAITIAMWRLLGRSNSSTWVTVLTWLAMATMFYATLLLASRGMIIALAITAVAMLARLVALTWRALLVALAVSIVVGASFLLPGSSGLLDRFQGDSVETGGGRIPVWQLTVDTYMSGGPLPLLIGNGFKSSEAIVEQRFAFTSVHNAYLQILYEFGLLGLSLFLLVHLRLIYVGWRLGNESGLIAYGLTWFLLGANLSADTPDGFLYWTALGLVGAIVVWGASGQGNLGGSRV